MQREGNAMINVPSKLRDGLETLFEKRTAEKYFASKFARSESKHFEIALFLSIRASYFVRNANGSGGNVVKNIEQKNKKLRTLKKRLH